MSSAKTQNTAAYREERVTLGVATEELFSVLPFRLFFADFLVVQNLGYRRRLGLLPSRFIPYLSVYRFSPL